MKKVQIDSIRVTQDEARELMIHHLRLAQRFYEALEDNSDADTVREAERILLDDDAALAGALAFILAVQRYYNELKKEYV